MTDGTVAAHLGTAMADRVPVTSRSSSCAWSTSSCRPVPGSKPARRSWVLVIILGIGRDRRNVVAAAVPGDGVRHRRPVLPGLAEVLLPLRFRPADRRRSGVATGCWSLCTAATVALPAAAGAVGDPVRLRLRRAWSRLWSAHCSGRSWGAYVGARRDLAQLAAGPGGPGRGGTRTAVGAGQAGRAGPDRQGDARRAGAQGIPDRAAGRRTRGQPGYGCRQGAAHRRSDPYDRPGGAGGLAGRARSAAGRPVDRRGRWGGGPGSATGHRRRRGAGRVVEGGRGAGGDSRWTSRRCRIPSAAPSTGWSRRR